MTDPRYPIGKFRFPENATAETRREQIAAIAACPAEMRRALAGLSDEQLDTPYREGGWTLRQLAHHVADSHMNAYIRHKVAATEETPTVKPYDEKAWAGLVDGRTAPPGISLSLLAALHDRWVRFLESLAPEQLERTFLQPEIPRPVTLAASVAMYAWHSRHHVAHIDALRQQKGW